MGVRCVRVCMYEYEFRFAQYARQMITDLDIATREEEEEEAVDCHLMHPHNKQNIEAVTHLMKKRSLVLLPKCALNGKEDGQDAADVVNELHSDCVIRTFCSNDGESGTSSMFTFGRELIIRSQRASCHWCTSSECVSIKKRKRERSSRSRNCFHCNNVKKAQRFLSKEMITFATYKDLNKSEEDALHLFVSGTNAAMVQLNNKSVVEQGLTGRIIPGDEKCDRTSKFVTGDEGIVRDELLSDRPTSKVWFGAGSNLPIAEGNEISFVSLDREKDRTVEGSASHALSPVFDPLKFIVVDVATCDKVLSESNDDDEIHCSKKELDSDSNCTPMLSMQINASFCLTETQQSDLSIQPLQSTNSQKSSGVPCMQDDGIQTCVLNEEHVKSLKMKYSVGSCIHSLLHLLLLNNVSKDMYQIPSILSEICIERLVNNE